MIKYEKRVENLISIRDLRSFRLCPDIDTKISLLLTWMLSSLEGECDTYLGCASASLCLEQNPRTSSFLPVFTMHCAGLGTHGTSIPRWCRFRVVSSSGRPLPSTRRKTSDVVDWFLKHATNCCKKGSICWHGNAGES